MTIDEYLEFYGITQTRFAEMCGVTRATLNNISAKRRFTSVPLAMLIEELTEGKVNPFDIIPKSLHKRLTMALTFKEKNKRIRK